MKRRTFISLAIAGLLSLSMTVAAQPSLKNRISVAASFDAMAELVKVVGGDHVTIETLIPPGTEPHDFTPTVQTATLLKKTHLFVINGLGMEPWAKKLATNVDNPDLRIVTASDGAVPIRNTDPDEVKEHGANDPHLWLSLSGAQIESSNIADALSKVDPKNAATFRKNAVAFQKELATLKLHYAKQFASSKRKFFVTGHAAFAYLCRDFGLEQKSVEGVFAEGEPTPKQLAQLSVELRKSGVKTVFSEELASPAVSETLAREAGAKVETIYTMESQENGKSYLARMKSNLEKISRALNE